MVVTKLKLKQLVVGDVTGPAGAGNGNIAVFDGITGKIIKDGGAPAGGGDVYGDVGATDGHLAVFDGDGYHIKDGGVIGGILTYPCDGRLTLESGVPISMSDQVDKTTLYFTPYKGDSIAVYDGASAWIAFTFAEKSLNIAAFTASKPYDIFIYDNTC